MIALTLVLGLLWSSSLPMASSKTSASMDWSMNINNMLHYPILSKLSRQQQQHRRTDEILTNNSLEDDDDISQVVIQDFKVLLSLRKSDKSATASTTAALDHDALADEIENAILQEFAQELIADEEDAIVSYVQLIGPVRDGTGLAGTYADSSSAVLVFPGGAAVFEGSYVPTKSQLDVWIQQAVEGRLVSNLHAQSSLYDSIQKATYLSDRVGVSGVQQDVDKNGGGDDDDVEWLPIVLGAGIGGVVVLALLALLITRKRRRRRHSALAKHHLDAHDKHHSKDNARELTTGDLTKSAVVVAATTTTAVATSTSPGATTSADDSLEEGDCERNSPQRHGMARQIFPRIILDEAKSVGAGSESSFTVGSEAGDSTGLKSASFQNYDAPPMVAKESFEHERRVTLRKDMLTSTWIGQVSPSQGRPGQIESVLEPSHFTASQERSSQRQRQQEATDAWANGADVDPSSSLRFESSSGDDAYLQRPMQRNGELI